MNRNIAILSICQAFGMAGAPVIVLLGGIIGAELSPNPSWVTLPIAVMVIGGAVFSVPAALFMQKVGRRTGFIVGSCIAAISSFGAGYAIASSSFALFCLSTLGIGGNMAFVQQYRFAAAESVDKAHVGRAVSFVLVGGIFAAFLGPELAKIFKDSLKYGSYSGSFAALTLVFILNGFVLSFLRVPPINGSVSGNQRPLKKIISQKIFFAAVMAGLVAYGVMTFIMTATPVSMHVLEGFSLSETKWVIQSHIMAMFIPSLFSGALIDRFGLLRIMIAGVFLMALCAGITLINRHFIHYWGGLVLLGVGWNFLFVGGTTLLTRTYNSAERFKVQAINDVSIYGFQAAASLSAGAVIFRYGWETVNIIALPLLFIMLVVLLRIRRFL